MQQRHKNLDVSGRICITPNNKVFLGGHHHQAAAALACLIRVRKKTKTPKLFDHSSFTLRMYQIPFKIGTLGHEFLTLSNMGAYGNQYSHPLGMGRALIQFFGRLSSSSSSSSLGLIDSREEKYEDSKVFDHSSFTLCMY